ncbi:MAG: hypothetical protein ACXW00_12400, partial [Methylobacter sp.]
FNPNCTVSRPQPNTLSDRRALPWQYFNVIAAWKARRSAPDIFELANFKSSIWYAFKGKREGSVVDRKVALGG